MAGVYKLEITESEEKLKEMLGKQKTASDQERVQVLYLPEKQASRNRTSCRPTNR